MAQRSLLDTDRTPVNVPTAMGEQPNGTRRHALGDAVILSLAYAAVFDFAMTRRELHRYLIGMECRPDELGQMLDDDPRLSQHVITRGDLVTLRGRDGLFATRTERDRATARQWPTARRYARAVASLPFVRMVAVTGGLAAGNAVEGGDVDLLVVTRTGRLWLSRASTIAIVRYAAWRGWDVCPNYFLTQRAVNLTDQDLYAASELVRMVPIAGHRVYQRMRARNAWAAGYFPNARGLPAGASEVAPLMPHLRAAAEWVMSQPPVGWVEDWERQRKVTRFQSQALAAGVATDETAFGVDRCKGHFDAHRSRIRLAFEHNARAAGVEPIW
jgi:hypothetical protein